MNECGGRTARKHNAFCDICQMAKVSNSRAQRLMRGGVKSQCDDGKDTQRAWICWTIKTILTGCHTVLWRR